MKTKTKKQKAVEVSEAKKRSDAALKPLVLFAQKNPGTITRIAEGLTRLTGQTQYRQNVGEWLHPDPARRVEPKLGIGLLLIDLGEKYRGKKAKP